MQIKTTIALIILLTGTIAFRVSETVDDTTESIGNDLMSVEYPEVYELANIVLALTEYGITDKWQVRKDFGYYDEMRSYFSDFMDHPLLDSVNFSRERWKEYLSYRTDSYAFELTDNYELKRKNDFQSFEIKTFDKYKALSEDFACKSNFKDFFNQNSSKYDRIIQSYQKEYLLEEMKQFLSDEFGDLFTGKKYSIVISPFVYAQNLHRDIDSMWTADFPTVAKQIIEGNGFEDESNKSSEIHTLFTEMDHGYVNPTSAQYNIPHKFSEDIWDAESGYADAGNSVFNEYMTWAVFDIFNKKHFSEIADKINLNWHFQNDTRGFPYSRLFATKLIEEYEKNEGNTKIKDLYPVILEWANKVQSELSKPILVSDSDTIQISGNKQTIELRFSEPMEKVTDFDVVFQYSQWDSETIQIGKESNLIWDKNGESLKFEIELPDRSEYYLLLNWWGVGNPLISQKGVLLEAASGFIIRGNSTDE